MGDLDTCLDAFKHLPYFKPLYTTILRQQMQYLTEQLSRHAGEESLVLTTNLSAGTISSLTSTYGTGFLDLRSDIKKQFTVHCAKNRMKHDRTYNRRNVNIDNSYLKDHTISLKRKKSDDHHQQHAANDSYFQSGQMLNSHDTCIPPEKDEENVSKTDLAITNIGIENVRSLQPEEDADIECNKEVKKSAENRVAASNVQDDNCRNEVIIKVEPKSEESFIIAEATQELYQSKASDESQENVIVITETDSNNLRECAEEEINPLSAQQRNTDSMHVTTDDVETIRNSYFDNEEPSFLPENIDTESDGNGMWIIAGNNNGIELTEVSHNKSNESRSVDYHTCPQIAEASLGKFVGPAANQTYENQVHVITTYEKVPSSYKTDAKSEMPVRILSHNLAEKRGKFNCNYCSQSFTTFASRKRHERRHTGETPWACEYCDKKFYRKDDLNVHSLKHSGQKPYMCPICHSGFCKKKMLETHVLASHASSMMNNSLQYLFS